MVLWLVVGCCGCWLLLVVVVVVGCCGCWLLVVGSPRKHLLFAP